MSILLRRKQPFVNQQQCKESKPFWFEPISLISGIFQVAVQS